MGIKNIKQENKRPSYPYVGYNSKANVYVLFVGSTKGFVISDCLAYCLGEWSEAWVEHNFTPIEYTVTFDLS